MKPEEKIQTFLEIAKQINTELECVPVLYGSLGLWRIAKHPFHVDDVDILVPDEFMKAKWPLLQNLVESQGYTLVSLREHEFDKSGQKVAFAGFTALVDDLGINLDGLKTSEESGARFRELSLENFLAAYEYSLDDSYRKDVRMKKDLDKIDFIKRILG
jgi:hypothetical protein